MACSLRVAVFEILDDIVKGRAGRGLRTAAAGMARVRARRIFKCLKRGMSGEGNCA